MHLAASRRRSLIALLLLAAVPLACARKDAAPAAEMAPAGSAEAPPPAEPAAATSGAAPLAPATLAAPAGAPADRRKMIVTGRMELLVPTYAAARDRLDALVHAAGGHVDSTRVAHAEGAPVHAVLVVRVPGAALGALVPALRALGRVVDEQTDAADVTAVYADATARLTAARALERRLLELAATRTAALRDVLEVERELARVRGEIEALEGQLGGWDDQIALATFTVTLTTEAPLLAGPADPGFVAGVRAALDRSTAALVATLAALVTAAFALLPWSPLLAAPVVLAVRRRRRRALARAVAQPAAAATSA